MKVWYLGTKPRTTGLRLVPGWNELPVATATVLIERGIVVQSQPGTQEEEKRPEEPLEEDGEKTTSGKKSRRARRTTG